MKETVKAGPAKVAEAVKKMFQDPAGALGSAAKASSPDPNNPVEQAHRKAAPPEAGGTGSGAGYPADAESRESSRVQGGSAGGGSAER